VVDSWLFCWIKFGFPLIIEVVATPSLSPLAKERGIKGWCF
jgi:hypothetical protein